MSLAAKLPTGRSARLAENKNSCTSTQVNASFWRLLMNTAVETSFVNQSYMIKILIRCLLEEILKIELVVLFKV